jgi:hypothetical protein
MPTDPIPSDPRRGLDRPGGSFVAAIEAGGQLADLVVKAEARDEERSRITRDVAVRTSDLISPLNNK